MPADAGGEVGRTNTVARLPDEELLRCPVLERVEADDRETSAGTQCAHGGLEALLKILELMVDGDAQRLEHTRRGVDATPALCLHARDEATEIVGGEERFPRAATYDRGGNATCLGLLAELAERAAQLALVPAVHYVRRRDAEVRVGTHVQWAFRAKAEASPLVCELERGETEVEEDPVERRETVLAGHDVEKRKVGADEDGALTETCEDAMSFGESRGVDVEADEATVRAGVFEDRFGVAARADRAVEKAATFAGIKLGEYFGQKNRLMKPPIGAVPVTTTSWSSTARSRGPRDRPRSRFGRGRGCSASVPAPRPRGGRNCR
jgi:hypothetical protein